LAEEVINTRNLKNLVKPYLFVLIGAALVWVVRPYGVQMMQGLSIFMAAGLILFGIVQIKKLSGSTVKRLVIIPIFFIFLIVSLTPFTKGGVEVADSEVKKVPKTQIAAEYRHWQQTLPPQADNLFHTIARLRNGLIDGYPDAESNIDTHIRFHKAADFVFYFPRAVEIAFLAPFPNMWINNGSAVNSSFIRKISGIEMLGIYFVLLCAALSFKKWRKIPAWWILIFFCSSMMVIYTYTNINMGTLYRMRYGFIMTIAALGLAYLFNEVLFRADKGTADKGTVLLSDRACQTEEPSPCLPPCLTPPRLLFVITQGIRGGAQNHVRDVARCLHSLGYDVQVAVGVEGPLIDELESSGISVHHIPPLVREISPVKDFKAYLELTGLVKRIQPDLITTHSSKAGILGRLVCRRQNIPNVFTAHGWAFTEGISELKRWVYTFVERSAAKWTDRIICVSEYDRKLALDYSVAAEAKLIAVHNGIPLLEDVDLARPDKGDVVNIIMVARFSEQKDHGLLLEAVPNINSRQRFRVQLVGDGEKFDEMMTRAQQMGLENVEFLGNRSDVASLLSQAHIFVLTSNWEGFPLTILEAMQAGLPVVASDVGGVREAVTEGTTGYLIPRGDVQTLTSRLQYLINEPGIRAQMGINARRIFEENFTLDKMMHETIAVYEKVLQDRVAGKGQ